MAQVNCKADVTEADWVRSSTATQRSEPAGGFMEVGQEVVQGMRLRAICRWPQGRIARQ